MHGWIHFGDGAHQSDGLASCIFPRVQEYPFGIGQALNRMKSRMLFRDWCPSVMAEYTDMYQGGSPGIFQVVDADLAGYQMPMTVWSRGYSVYQNKPASEESYMVSTKDACSKEITQIANNATDHPEGTSGWQCIQFAVLNYAFLPYKNPQKRTCEVLGQPQLGNTNPCPDIHRCVLDFRLVHPFVVLSPTTAAHRFDSQSGSSGSFSANVRLPAAPAHSRPTSICRSRNNGTELAPMQGPQVVAELVDTVLDAWSMLDWSTKYPSNPFAIQVTDLAALRGRNVHPIMGVSPRRRRMYLVIRGTNAYGFMAASPRSKRQVMIAHRRGC